MSSASVLDIDDPRIADRLRADLRARRLRASGGYLGSRLLWSLVVLWATITVTFIAIQLAPGDIVDYLIGQQPRTAELVAAVTEKWGLDRPVWEQYATYISRALTGDLGTSYAFHRPVGELIGTQLPATIGLALAAAFVAIAFATVVAGVTAGRARASRAASLVELILIGTPGFWLGVVLLSVFSFGLGWFPVSGDEGLGPLVLPALALGIGIGAVLSQVLRQGLERALEEPFATSVLARGVSRGAFVLIHAFRHAALPVVTLSGWVVGGLLGGAVIVEQLFGRPGLGQLALAAANQQDVPLILGIVLITTVSFIAVSAIVDVLYLVIDPRLRSASDLTESGS